MANETTYLLVGFYPGLTDDEHAEIIHDAGAAKVKKHRAGAGDSYRVKVKGTTAENAAVLAALQAAAGVKYACEDESFPVGDLTPTDPHYQNQWHHTTIGSATAWNYATGTGVKVAVLDTGVRATHPDLAGAVLAGWNAVISGGSSDDIHGHGTRVAGVIAARGNNGIGVVGVAFNCKILPVVVTDAAGNCLAGDLGEGITWAWQNGAKVINISIGNVPGNAHVLDKAAVARQNGCHVVTGSGNSSGALSFAASDAVLAVAATTSSDARASYSSTGAYVDLAAPGSGIWTTDRAGGYTAASGTSYSSPVVAGVLALMVEVAPTLTVAARETILLTIGTGVTDLGTAGYDTSFGYGRVSASGAVAAAFSQAGGTADTTAPAVAFTAPASGATVAGVVTVQVTATDAGGVQSVSFLVDGETRHTDTTSPFTFAWDTTLETNASHTLGATAVDNAGNTGTATTRTVTVNNVVAAPPDTTAPTVSITAPANLATVSGTVSVTATATDAVGVQSTGFYVDGVLKATDVTNPWGFSWDTRTATNGTHTLVARASDAAGNVGTSSTITVTVSNLLDAPECVVTSVTQISATQFTIAATASQSGGSIQSVQFYKNKAYVGSDFTSAYTKTVTGVSGTTYQIQALAYNTLGVRTWSPMVTFTMS